MSDFGEDQTYEDGKQTNDEIQPKCTMFFSTYTRSLILNVCLGPQDFCNYLSKCCKHFTRYDLFRSN